MGISEQVSPNLEILFPCLAAIICHMTDSLGSTRVGSSLTICLSRLILFGQLQYQGLAVPLSHHQVSLVYLSDQEQISVSHFQTLVVSPVAQMKFPSVQALQQQL